MRRRIFVLGLLLSSGTAWSATDLVTAWQAARGHDPAWQAAAAGAQAGSRKADQARALWRPTLGLQAGAGFVDMKNEVNGASFSAPAIGSMSNARFVTQIHGGHDARVALVAMQPLYNPERSASAAQLEQQAQLATTGLRQSEQMLFLRVAQSYFDVLGAEDALATLQAQKRAVQESLDIAKELFRVGKSASTDMHEAQAGFDAVVAQEFAAQSELELKRAAFSDLTGLPATPLARLRADARLDDLRPADMQALIERALTQNPAVQMSDTGREIARLEVDKHRLTGSASVDLVAQYQQQRVDGENGAGAASSTSHTAWIGVQLNVPLFTGGMRSARQAEAVALADKARLEADAARQMEAQRVRAAYLGVTTGLQQIRALEQGLLSASKKLDATQTGQELGARTTSDVLNAQQAYFGVQNNLLRARYQVLLASLSLAAATGELDAARFEAVNALLGR